MGHRRGDDRSCRDVAIIGFEYMFATSSNLHSRDEWDGCDELTENKPVLKVLAVRDMRWKAIFAHAAEAALQTKMHSLCSAL